MAAAKTTKAKPVTPFGSQKLGKTYLGLLEEFGAEWGNDVFSVVGTKKNQDAYVIDYCRKEHGIELIGRSHGGLCFFGISPSGDEPTVDQRPVLLVDNKGTGPEIAAKNLADYLSLCAYARTWGRTPKQWAALRKEDLADEEFQQISERLLGIPSVKLPREPWKLQQALPKLKIATNPTDQFQSLFAKAVGKLSLLLVWDEMTDDTTIGVLVDGPSELEDILPSHPLVVDPLKAFVTSLRSAFPNKKFRVGVSYDTLGADGTSETERANASWKRLETALKNAGKMDVYAELVAHRED